MTALITDEEIAAIERSLNDIELAVVARIRADAEKLKVAVEALRFIAQEVYDENDCLITCEEVEMAQAALAKIRGMK